MELELLGRYAQARRGSSREFNTSGFARIYSTVAAQRASKILGIFARLNRRDGKPQYLRHIRNICDTCHAYGDICSARWRIPRLPRSTPGTAPMCGRRRRWRDASSRGALEGKQAWCKSTRRPSLATP
jgi:hypothetical protein